MILLHNNQINNLWESVKSVAKYAVAIVFCPHMTQINTDAISIAKKFLVHRLRRAI